MKEGGRGHDLDIYLGPTAGGGAMALCRWAVVGTRVNGFMQEQEETIFESAGELEVAREMGGNAER